MDQFPSLIDQFSLWIRGLSANFAIGGFVAFVVFFGLVAAGIKNMRSEVD